MVTHGEGSPKVGPMFLCCSTGVGIYYIGALGLTEGAKAAIYVFGSHGKVVSGARLELGECAGHW